MNDKKANDQMLEAKKYYDKLQSGGNAFDEFLRGLMLGSLGFSGIYGAAEGIKGLTDYLVPEPKIPRDITLKIPSIPPALKDKKSKKGMEKQNALSKNAQGWISDFVFGPTILETYKALVGMLPNIPSNLALGAGLLSGGYGGYRLIKELNRKSDEAQFAKAVNKIQDIYSNKYTPKEEEEFSEEVKTACAHEYYNGFFAGLEKEGMINTKELEKSSATTAGDIGMMILGGLLPLGFLTGYYGLKQMYPIPEEMNIAEEEKYNPRLIVKEEDDEVPSKRSGVKMAGDNDNDKGPVDKLTELWTTDIPYILNAPLLYDLAGSVPKYLPHALGGVGALYLMSKANDIWSNYVDYYGRKKAKEQEEEQ